MATAASDSVRVTSRGRRWLFRFFALGLSLALLELMSFGIWWIELPTVTFDGAKGRRASVIETGQTATHPTEAIHPYLGWVLNPDLHPAQEAGGRTFAVNDLGFVDDGETRYRRTPDRYLVGIIGGSVAQHISLLSDGILLRRLEAAPELQGRKVQFVRLALSGHKQPQQLMSLAYLLSQGGELDLLINIDGYNEAALTITENVAFGVSMSYPRSWHHRLQDVVDPRIDSHSFHLLRLRVSRRRAARFFERPVLRDSPTANLAWFIYDCWVDRSLAELGIDVREHRNQHGHGFAKDGPQDRLSSDAEVADMACRIWEQGSRQLDRLCRSNSICYLHVLQPNQYLAGSKPLSAVELEKYYAPEERFAGAVRTIYPMMRAAGANLRAEGVGFRDATQVFANAAETLYCDYFCHYNQQGNDLLAESVASWALEEIHRTAAGAPTPQSSENTAIRQ